MLLCDDNTIKEFISMAKQNENYKRMTIWVNKEFKDKGDEIIYDLGMTPTSIINILYRQIVYKGGIPFDITVARLNKEYIDEVNKI